MQIDGNWKDALLKISQRFDYKFKSQDDFSKIRDNWQDILNDQALFRFCFPEYFKDGILAVKANSSSAFSVFMGKKDKILDNIRKVLPSVNVINIVVTR